MKDRQGIIRGKCTTPECECSEYMTSQDSSSARCEYCDHVPVKHVKMIKLGACLKCKECDKYEEPGSYSNCGYCECPAQHHQGAEKCNRELFSSRPAVTQASMGPPTMLGAPSGGPPPGPPPTAPGQCKIPGCTKPCFVEKGRVHEFCGRTHAELYKKQQKQQAPQPTPIAMYKAPPSQQPKFTGVYSVASTATGQATDSTSVVRACTICKVLPKIRRCVHFYKNVWSEGDKYGLYVTGLTLGESTTLCLADLICGITSDVFDNKTTYSDMMAKYNTVTGGYGRIFRKFNFDLICKKAQEKGLAIKCDAGSKNIAFFLQNTPVSGMGLQTKDQQVTIMEVNGGSIAELSGICTGDIIHCIGSVNQDQMDKFEFKDVTKQKNVTSVLTTQSPNVIGSVLIIERSTMSYV